MYFLPPQYKNDLKAIKKSKIALSISLSFGISLLFSLLSLFIAVNYFNQVLSSIQLSNSREQLLIEKYKKEGLDKEIINFDKKLRSIKDFYDSQVYVLDIYNIIAKELKDRGRVSSLTISRIKNPEGKIVYQVSLSGSIPTRELLGQVRDGLASYEQIPEESIIAQLATWISPDSFNISFQYIGNNDNQKGK